ncbi:CYTH domain-containing protein [Myroides sp. 1354]|uniref:CYTH domain-containing protein n=1 Tax=unclassified Myroides TaxID=2642485 RepID=UPI002577EA99|nr:MULTISPECIES: CYTH domain-containing protein [unclassified Myroides]MDM1045528.1 CYTH domain-containing protein [Myroides sp. R163-1]MDM1056530.1 CYTH domain-containing protein [Myroides sp. 1354]MDM1069600.1 CYTH domain-containing protein [Myroides sp. 1372]
MIEIERKFRTKCTNFERLAHSKSTIAQGYLNSDAERTVRVRLKNNKGYLTIKGKSNATGTSRFEWEKEIDYQEAEALLTLCEDHVISKTRYLIPVGKHLFEVDVFHGKNEGLVIAEVELQDENEVFEKPEWLGEEVTGQLEYYNSYLSNHPFTTWK